MSGSIPKTTICWDKGNLGIAGREAFKYEGKDHLRKHHLYVCPEDSPELKRHIAFRDYLRTHPDAVREYSHIKEEGAELWYSRGTRYSGDQEKNQHYFICNKLY